jgi:hypothetical protein
MRQGESKEFTRNQNRFLHQLQQRRERVTKHLTKKNLTAGDRARFKEVLATIDKQREKMIQVYSTSQFGNQGALPLPSSERPVKESSFNVKRIRARAAAVLGSPPLQPHGYARAMLATPPPIPGSSDDTGAFNKNDMLAAGEGDRRPDVQYAPMKVAANSPPVDVSTTAREASNSASPKTAVSQGVLARVAKAFREGTNDKETDREVGDSGFFEDPPGMFLHKGGVAHKKSKKARSEAPAKSPVKEKTMAARRTGGPFSDMKKAMNNGKKRT